MTIFVEVRVRNGTLDLSILAETFTYDYARNLVKSLIYDARKAAEQQGIKLEGSVTIDFEVIDL